MDEDIFNSIGVRRMQDRNDLKGPAVASVSVSASGPTSTSAAAAAASRQKSCNACVRGKRRCDKTKPRCNRCADKGLECVYQKRTAAARAPSPPSSSSSVSVVDNTHYTDSNSTFNTTRNNTSTSTSTDSGLYTGVDVGSDFPMGGFGMDMSDHHTGFGGLDTSASGSGKGTTSPETLQIDPSLDFSIADLINGTHGGHDSWNLPMFSETKADFPVPVPIPMAPPAEQPRTQIRDLTLYNESKERGCDLNTDLLQVHDPRTRIGFALDYFTKMHIAFAQTRTACFIHPRLYAANLPKSMMSAFCAASAYANRTPDTKAWALRLLSDAAREVYAEGHTATTPHEKLARVQAIALLDSMRILDGDIGLRHAAEKDKSVFISWVHELFQLKDEVEAGETPMKASKEQPPKSWEHWILAESMRRTGLFCMYFYCLMTLLKSEMPDENLWVGGQSFTASRHLWEATSTADFFRAWREQPQWGIQDTGFKDFWMYARPEDTDEFTKVLLMTQVGPDGVDQFMQGDAIPVM